MTRAEFHARWTDELLGIAVRTLITGQDVAQGLFIRDRIAKVRDVLDRIYNDLTGDQHSLPTTANNSTGQANALRPGDTNARPANSQQHGDSQRRPQPAAPANGQTQAKPPTGPNAPASGKAGPVAR